MEGMSGSSQVKEKETAANMVLSELERTAERAQKIAAVVAERTSSVIRAASPNTSEEAKKPVSPELPPLFELIRLKMVSINNSLSDLEDIMRRCEL